MYYPFLTEVPYATVQSNVRAWRFDAMDWILMNGKIMVSTRVR